MGEQIIVLVDRRLCGLVKTEPWDTLRLTTLGCYSTPLGSLFGASDSIGEQNIVNSPKEQIQDHFFLSVSILWRLLLHMRLYSAMQRPKTSRNAVEVPGLLARRSRSPACCMLPK
jgi:hypothetical protein